MPNLEITYGAAYVSQLEEIRSNKLVEHIFQLEDELLLFPDMGSPVVRESLVARYGPDLRKLVAGSHLLIYRHEGERIRMLACIPASGVA